MIQLDEEAEADKAVAGEWELLACMFRTLIADASSADGVKRASVDHFCARAGRSGGRPHWAWTASPPPCAADCTSPHAAPRTRRSGGSGLPTPTPRTGRQGHARGGTERAGAGISGMS
jgi:hypothetical protein